MLCISACCAQLNRRNELGAARAKRTPRIGPSGYQVLDLGSDSEFDFIARNPTIVSFRKRLKLLDIPSLVVSLVLFLSAYFCSAVLAVMLDEYSHGTPSA